jgi:hypothetical protein
MDTAKLQAFGDRAQALMTELGQGVQAHPIFFGVGLLFLLLTWSHFKGEYGPQTWSLAPERNKALRGFVHVLVMPFRLLAALFSSAVALAVIALVAGFGYALWRMMQ